MKRWGFAGSGFVAPLFTAQVASAQEDPWGYLACDAATSAFVSSCPNMKVDAAPKPRSGAIPSGGEGRPVRVRRKS